MEAEFSKAELLSKKRTEKYIRTYKYFNYAFYVHLTCFIIVMAVDIKQVSGAMSGLWALTWIGSGLAYIMFLGTLVGGANKSVVQWVGGTIIFNYIGMFVSYYKMKNVALEQGWTK